MAQPLTKVEVLLDWKALPTYAGFFLAKDLGAFEPRGLDVTFGEVRAPGPPRRSATDRNMDRLVERQGHGNRPLEGPADQEPGRLLPQDAERDLQPCRGPHRPPRDLYGKRLGMVPGSITNEEFRALVGLNRLQRDKIQEVKVDWTRGP